MYYILRLKNREHGRVDRIQAKNLNEARLFYIARKQMDTKVFDKLYSVEEDTNE